MGASHNPLPNKMRYFFVSFTCNSANGLISGNIGVEQLIYPTISTIREAIVRRQPTFDNIIVMGISEMVEEDYHNFWK